MKRAAQLLISALALSAASTAWAGEPAKPADPADATATADEGADPDMDKIVCKSAKATGSRLKAAKRCQTKRQWAAEQAILRQTLEKAQAARWKEGN